MPAKPTSACRATTTNDGDRPVPARSPHSETGSVSVLVAVLSLSMLLMAGLVVDGGRQLIAYRRAANDAEQAARVGAAALNPAALRGGSYTLDPAAATAAAARYLSAAAGQNGVQITGSRVTVTGNTVAVQLTLRRTTTFLAVLGVTGLTATGRGRARLVHGVVREDP